MEQKEPAFLKAYDNYADAMFRFCYAKTSDRNMALDLTQEVFVRAWERIQAGDEIRNMRAFLYKIATNLVIDHYRKKKSVSLDALHEAGFDPGADGDALRVAEGGEVIRALRQLEEPYQTALTLRFVEGLSPEEIADIVGETPNAISVRIHRGLEKLRELFLHR